MNLENLVFEALVENLLVARYFIDFRKDPLEWKRFGCYGFPAAILLFSITDMIGSYILGGSTKNHFNIFNNSDYYNLGLTDEELKELYDHYRCLLTHNGALPIGRLLDIGHSSQPIFTKTESGDLILNLVPFWNKTYYCVQKFLETVSLQGNMQAEYISKIPQPIK